jgi:hypothetical protein
MNKIVELWLTLFFLGLFLINYPVITIFDHPIFIFGIPILFIYLIAGWLVSIFIIYIFVKVLDKHNDQL